MTSHHMGEGYSERHRVPTVQEYREIEAQRQAASATSASQAPQSASDELPPGSQGQGVGQSQAAPAIPDGLRQRKGAGTGSGFQTDGAAPIPPPKDGDEGRLPPKDDQVNQAGGGADEKERIKQQMAPKGKANEIKTKGERRVRDPVTGQDVIIRDGSDKAQIDPRKLDPDNKEGFSTNMPSNADHKVLNTNPAPAEPSSILLQQFPPPANTDAMKRLQSTFDQLAIALAAAMAITWFFVSFGSGWFRFFFRSSILAAVGIGGWSALHIASRKIEKEVEAVRMDMHTQRGEKHSPPMPESAEWLNAAIAVVWKQINPDMFIPMADMVEDIMQQSLPGFVDAVKIADIGQGTNPFRFIAFRGLPDMMTDKAYPREEWINQGKSPSPAGKKEGTGELRADGNEEDTDESGDFLNYEISFSYSAKPGQNNRSENIHLLLEFFLGAYDLFQIPIPIWVNVEQLSGTIRLRAQMVQNPPYIRNLTFTLMGVPKVEVSVVPMSRHLPNVLDLPIVSSFVQSSIAAAANEYVAPKSMTLNMAQMLSGDGVKKDTDAVGILQVNIMHGEGLSAQDANGSSDPYVVLSFAKFGRPLYSTRIIFEDLNPVWMETAFLLVTKDDIRADEHLSVQLWDSDKRTADDIVGRVNKSLKEIMSKPNELTSHKDGLMGFEDADTMSGSLHWSVGFFEKAKLNRDLMDQRNKDEKSEIEQQTDRSAAAVDSKEEADALHCPPDPKWPSGILSMIVHNIEGLETREVEEGVKGKEREGTAGQDVDAPARRLPSGYCEMIVNDDIIYKTRVKQYTNAPFFEAGTEAFVRDWTKAHARVVVRDARLREHDPIMGIVSMNLKDLFESSSQVTRLFSLQDGVGFGKVNCSFVFKAVKLELPRPLLGWDTATVELLSEVRIEANSPEWESKLNVKKIVASTGDDTQKLAPPGSQRPDTSGGNVDAEALYRLPVYDRFASNLTFEIGGGGGIGPLGGKPDGIAVLALRDLVDDETKEVSLPILAGEKLGTLKRNYINDMTKATHKYEEVGKLIVTLRLDSGLDDDHQRLAVGQTDRHEYEVYNRLEGMPKRAELNSHAADDGVIDRQEQKRISKAKREALHSRHRGVMGYAPARSSVWAKDGMKDRARSMKNKILGKEERDQTVKSEA